jgi:hypothetical protein
LPIAVQKRVDRNSVEPGSQSALIADTVESPPGNQQGVLTKVVTFIAIPAEPPTESDQPTMLRL